MTTNMYFLFVLKKKYCTVTKHLHSHTHTHSAGVFTDSLYHCHSQLSRRCLCCHGSEPSHICTERAVRAGPARVRLWCGLVSLVAKEPRVSSRHPHPPPAPDGSMGRAGATSPMQPLLTRFSEFQNGLFLESQFLEHHFSEFRKCIFLNCRNLFSLCQLDIDFLKITLFSLVLVSLKIPMLFLGSDIQVR